MVISHKHRFVFVEVPHTGSHSIADQLIAHYGGEMILRKHANVTQFLAQASTEEREYFKFATVRNPLDSATTDYAKLKSNHKNQFTSDRARIENGGHVTLQHREEFDYVHNQGMSFAEFLKRYRSRIYNNWFLIREAELEYVIRFEHLQEGFSEVLNRVGATEMGPLSHVNPTKQKSQNFSEYYNAEVRELAMTCYGPFMQKWGYDFPSEWTEYKVPRLARWQFNALLRAGNIAAKFGALDPNHPIIAAAKRAADRITAKRA